MGWDGDNKNLSTADCLGQLWGKVERLRESYTRQIIRILPCFFNFPGQDLTPDPYPGLMSG